MHDCGKQSLLFFFCIYLILFVAALFVVGNKTDLAENRRVPREQAQAYAAQVGAQYFETSAKADSGSFNPHKNNKLTKNHDQA